MKKILVLAGAAAAAAVVAGAVDAKLAPAWSYVPSTLRARLATAQGGALYLPARTPLFYRYRSGAGVRDGVLSVRFVDRVRVRQGLWRWTRKSFLWQVRPLAAGASCRDWATVERTLQLSGNKVYVSADAAWRCVTDRRGRTHVLSASNGGALPGVALGGVVASGLDVSRR